MRDFPAICLDNFYSKPDNVRRWALSQKFEGNEIGAWPGKRTKYLSELNPKLFNAFVNKLSYLFFDFTSRPEMTEVQTFFQVTEPYDVDKINTELGVTTVFIFPINKGLFFLIILKIV